MFKSNKGCLFIQLSLQKNLMLMLRKVLGMAYKKSVFHDSYRPHALLDLILNCVI